MKGSWLKYTFYLLAVILLAIILLTSKDAGITCDEVLHYNHSVSVYNYFASCGKDQSALNTPDTHLKFYGQSFDNLVTILIKWFDIDDVYRFRHLMSSFAGWLVILLTALFAVWLTGYRAGLIVLILFAVSPTFLGHSHNNLKDVPFSLGYIAASFYMVKFLVSGRRISIPVIILLTAAIAFSISIRAGGLILICYLYFFFIIYYLFKYLKYKQIDIAEVRTKLIWIICISAAAWFLSILLWPYALQGPVENVLGSYRLMAHFPGTFRQIFEGKFEWSDFMPWYYLLKSMAITIPLVVLTGLIIFIFFCRQVFKNEKRMLYGLIVFTVLFPLFFVIYEKSNLYSSWRQFLFIYPAIILLAGTGFYYLFENITGKFFKLGAVVIIAMLSIHPLKYMISNHPYYYLYYNQIVGGLNGAYTRYETDYYYVTETKASEWLIDYLGNKNITGRVKVKATYSVQWQFRDHPGIETSYFRYDERSQSDWDYAIVVNRYVSPDKLKNGLWPPADAIHIIYADNVPVCAVLERKSKDAFNGYLALEEGRNAEAVICFEKALEIDDKDEMIFYNFAAALYNLGEKQKADSLLKKGLEINPEFEPILMYLGNIARAENRNDEAIVYYERLINADRKYFEAYVALSGLVLKTDLTRARKLLRACLTINPGYKPAITALADTYRSTEPEIAEKYDKLAECVK